MLASRISEDTDKTVLVLEAGEDPGNVNENIDIPLFADMVRNSKYDWAYKTVPQKHACKSHVDQVGYFIFVMEHSISGAKLFQVWLKLSEVFHSKMFIHFHQLDVNFWKINNL